MGNRGVDGEEEELVEAKDGEEDSGEDKELLLA